MPRAAPTLLAAVLALPACAPDASSPDVHGSAGGKADDIQACEDGRTCLQFRSYDVRFTNPVCKTYPYDQPLEQVDGEALIDAKPKNVYCTKEHDSDPSGTRASSPQATLLDWIGQAGAGDEIFLAYLSFSDGKIAEALCEAEAKGAEVTFVLDKDSSKAMDVRNCGGEILIRGHQGSIQFAHNKLLMINPHGPGPADADDPDFVKLSFGSGNMSSGTHLHHENWHFIEVARESFFVEAHRCLIQALIPPELTEGKTPFKNFMNECREAIDLPREDDIIPFFIPVRDDSKALTAMLLDNIDAAEVIDIGAHRFSARDMIDGLAARLADTDRPFHMRLVADDDLYWLDPLPPSDVRVLGPNSFGDRDKVRQLRAADDGRGRMEEKYLETNNSLFLLHHNKFLIFEGMQGRRDALITGSANLTGTGFNDNLENNYFIDIPHVVEAFQVQFALFWDGEGPLPEGLEVAPRATFPTDMPIDILTPNVPAPDVPDPPQRCGTHIAEVVYDVRGSDNGREWIKLYNSCTEAVSLDGMSLGWGGRDYTTGSADLSGTIAGRSCVIVGGPSSEASNGAPEIDLAINFTPDLQNAGRDGDGIGLFDAGRDTVTALTPPLDAVVYGSDNDNGLIGPSGEVVEPHVGDARAGSSILRIDATTWEIAEPSPGHCPEF